MLTTPTNWAANLAYGAARVSRPTTLDGLRRVVADSPRVRAVGSGHSFSGVADTTGDLVRLDRLPAAVEIDPSAGTVSVAAAVRYAQLAPALHRAGYALSAMASLTELSVAGACATGTHGSGDRQRCLAGAVRGLQLVGPGGDLVELRRDGADGDFAGTVVALGALGVVTRLTLDIEPAYEVAQTVRLDVPLDEVVGDLDAVFAAAYSVSVFTDWREVATVWLKHRTDRPAGSWGGGRPASCDVHPVPGGPAWACTAQLGVAGPWHERLPHFRAGTLAETGDELQSELYLPRDRAVAALTAVRELAGLAGPVLQISEIRTVRADDLWLSPAYGRDSLTVHFTWVHNLAAVLPVLATIEQRLAPLEARPHWGKLTTLAPADIVAGYPRAGDFAALVGRFDPGAKFRNRFVDDLFPAG